MFDRWNYTNCVICNVGIANKSGGIEAFKKAHEDCLKKHLKSKNSIPLHNTRINCHLFISSLLCNILLFSRAVRGHWPFESMHWHLDVTFHENFNTTIDKTAALNQNIIRKFYLSILKSVNVGKSKERKY